MEENSSSNSIAKEEHDVSKETDDVPLKSVSRWLYYIGHECIL